MQVHLLDGTYELFRYHFALPPHLTAEGREVAATRGVVGTVLSMLEGGVTHLGVATDHVIESFRNELWDGYKSSAGVDPDLLQQFPLVEEVLEAAGVVVFPMVEHEADDALAAAAAIAAADERVSQVVICTPDKDLGQCVGGKVVQLDRRARTTVDRDGVRAKFGVEPTSIPDYLALVGDSADGFPGLAGWGAKSAAAVLARYRHIDAVPARSEDWDGVDVRNAGKLARTLRENLDAAMLFRRIATVERDAPVMASVDELAWTRPTDGFRARCEEIDAPGLADRAEALAAARA